jgi:hypothetical protein
LVKLILKQLLKVFGFNPWGVGSVPWDVASRMEKDKYLQEMIGSTCNAYAWRLKMVWDVNEWWRLTTYEHCASDIGSLEGKELATNSREW